MVNEDQLVDILEKAIEFVTQEYEVCANQKLNICYLQPESMIRLNENFVGHEGATDVITFDYRDELDEGDADDYIGEIYVCPFVASERACEFDNEFVNEVILYSIHGMLHLFGYDDQTDDDRIDMRLAESRVMKYLEEGNSFKGIYS